MLTSILREISDGDIMFYLQDTRRENAYEEVKDITDRLVEESNRELTRQMLATQYEDKDRLVANFCKITEEMRGYPLWMWEMWDIEDRASSWAEDNWYWYLFRDED